MRENFYIKKDLSEDPFYPFYIEGDSQVATLDIKGIVKTFMG